MIYHVYSEFTVILTVHSTADSVTNNTCELDHPLSAIFLGCFNQLEGCMGLCSGGCADTRAEIQQMVQGV